MFKPWITNARDLIATKSTPRAPIIDDVLSAGDTMNIVAPPKLGKSYFILQLLISIAAGIDWLGRFRTHQGRVLLIDNELHPDTISYRTKNVLETLNLPESVLENVDVASLRGDGGMYDLGEIYKLLNLQPKGTYKAIALDSLYRAFPQGIDENSNSNVTLLYNLLDQLASRQGSAAIVVHHLSKGSQVNKSVTDLGSGAGAQSRAVDCHMGLRPHKASGTVTLEAAVRACKPFHPLVLRREFPLWIVDEHLDAKDLRGKKADVTPEQFSEWLTTADPASRTKLIERAMSHLNISRETARQYLDNMIEEGTAKEHREGRNTFVTKVCA